jgi:hypothetical protein
MRSLLRFASAGASASTTPTSSCRRSWPRLAEHLERAGFVVMKKPPIGGSTPPYRGEAAP